MNERSRADFLSLQEQSKAGVRTTTVYSFGGRISDDQVGSIREDLAFIQQEEGRLTTRKVTLFESRVCDCGTALSQKNPVQGKCQHRGCTRYVCAACMQVCQRCQNTVCSYHSFRLDGKVYCRRCAPKRVLSMAVRAFFDIDDKEKEK